MKDHSNIWGNQTVFWGVESESIANDGGITWNYVFFNQKEFGPKFLITSAIKGHLLSRNPPRMRTSEWSYLKKIRRKNTQKIGAARDDVQEFPESYLNLAWCISYCQVHTKTSIWIIFGIHFDQVCYRGTTLQNGIMSTGFNLQLPINGESRGPIPSSWLIVTRAHPKWEGSRGTMP